MRDKTHKEFIEEWANYVKNNSDWKKIHTEFLDSQYNQSYRFIKKLRKEETGKEKIIRIYNIRNIKGYKKILR